MKNIQIIIIVLLVSCNSKEKSKFSIPSGIEINNIVQTIILEEKLPVKINSSKQVPLSKSLRKITISNNKNQFRNGPHYPPPINRNIEQMENLITSDYGEPFFESIDSSYFLFQNKVLNMFELKSIDSLNLSTNLDKTASYNTGMSQYYDISIPIFSLNRKKAYVVVTNNCKPDCGGAYAIYLEKEAESWKIRRRRIIWQN